MINLDDTQPNKPVQAEQVHDTKPKRPANFPPAPQQDFVTPPYRDEGGLHAPPRILLWGVIGLFILGIVGVVAGVFVFRDVLTPGQQVRVMGYMPFMEAFLPPHPAAGDILATARPVDEQAVQNLLNLALPGLGETPTDIPLALEQTQEVTPEVVATATEEPTPELTSEATPEVAMQPTFTPTIEPTVSPTEIPVTQQTQNVVSVASSPERTWELNWRNYGIQRVKQGWNDCGPANITMALSFYGWQRSQDYAANILKPNDEDKNVNPYELVNFVNEYSDIKALTRIGGDLNILRTLISNEFPVIIERGHMFEGYDWLGHYQTLIGYNDSQRTFTIYDSFLDGTETDEAIYDSYDELDSYWQHFNRTFIVVYEPAREERLLSLLGDLQEPEGAAEHAFTVAQQEAVANPQNSYAWFNMGTALTQLGRYKEASQAFDQAAQVGLPWRMLWYQFAPFEAFYNEGRYQDVLDYVTNNLTNGGEYVEETYYWQGRALAAMGDTAGARTAFNNALHHNRNYTAARQALDAL